MGSVLLIFIDGLGIGSADAAVNPLAANTLRVLNFSREQLDRRPRDGRIIPTDATLGVEGLPQSATSQATLFTGRNAARHIGRHLQGFPNRDLRELVGRHSLFRQVQEQDGRPTFANAYTERFFTDRPRWVSVTTVMCETAGVPLRRISDLLDERALFMDFSNRRLERFGETAPLRTPEEAGRILARLAPDYDLCLYEYFLTDFVGHRGTLEDASALLADLDRFLQSILDHLDLNETSVLIASDHGNIEDMSRTTHTRNPVPTMVWGELANAFDEETLRLDEITPIVLRYLG